VLDITASCDVHHNREPVTLLVNVGEDERIESRGGNNPSSTGQSFKTFIFRRSLSFKCLKTSIWKCSPTRDLTPRAPIAVAVPMF